MTRKERTILITLSALVLLMVIAIGTTYYITRIVPLDNAARTQVYYDATARAR
jgi:hypothetical protein